MAMIEKRYAGRPCPAELVLAILCGIGHVLLELATEGMRGEVMTPGPILRFYTLATALAWGFYLLWRSIVSPGALEAWGVRKKGFLPSLGTGALFAIVAAVPLSIYGAGHHRFPLPPTFWLVFALYVPWGLAQQFCIQALVTRNLRDLIPRLPVRVLAVASLFSAIHFPAFWLMVPTFIMGLAFTWIYERYRNIWALGIIHGFLGALALYLVLGEGHGWEQLATFLND
jgi:uncharacterized protein